MIALEQIYPDWRTRSIHESSPALRGVSVKLRKECPQYVPSHYIPGEPFGAINERLGVRNEDLEHQTFADDAFDIVITQDVFEHLFHPDLAIREIARTLRPGGAHIATVPIVMKAASSRRRASLGEDGSVHHHIEPPEYHGNPVDEKGSLVTFDYGYDMAAYMSAWSGLVTTLVYIDDITRGVRAEYIEVMVNRKLTESGGIT